jgi:ABC-type glycerol-3-phosphate transport system substrate-binding protein
MDNRPRWMFAVALVIGIIGATISTNTPSWAQEQIVLKVAVPGVMRDAFTANVIEAFESQNPGVSFVVTDAVSSIPTAADSLSAHLDQTAEYVASADILFVDYNRLTPEAVAAGYYLDLSPLTDSDMSLNTADYPPVVWQSYGWDSGVWALPFGVNTLILSYDPAALDVAGVTYPTSAWTFDELVNAIRQLAELDSAGNAVNPTFGVFPGTEAFLFRSLLSEGWVDTTTFPSEPRFVNPTLETMLDTWGALKREGYISDDYASTPLSITTPYGLFFKTTNGSPLHNGELLPGGRAGLDVQALAISAGTLYPEQAYRLAAFLTTRPEFAAFSTYPARISLLGQESENTTGLGLSLPPELLSLAELGIANGIAVSDMRYGQYISAAVRRIEADGTAASSVLQSLESDAVTAQQAAADRRASLVVAVATPVPSSDSTAGEITLNFGMSAFENYQMAITVWNDTIARFVEADPEVGAINLSASGEPIEQLTQKYDCFYLPYNAVRNAPVNLLLPLDPLTTTDPNFASEDVIGTTLTQLQRDGSLWALPVTLKTAVLSYDSEDFNRLGIPEPDNSWTVDYFTTSLTTLKESPEAPPALSVVNMGGTSTLALIAIYGGLPLDFRTQPITVNFTSPENVAAIQSVLDLARNGTIDYVPLGNFQLGAARTNREAAIYAEALNVFSTNQQTTRKQVLFPRGDQYSAVSYHIGTLYISANAVSPEACYRWMTTIAKTPGLFQGMPAYRSLLSDPAFTVTQGASLTAVYNELALILDDPNTVAIPSVFDSGVSLDETLLQYWLYQAFDQYVLHDADLLTELTNAETLALGFQQCIQQLPPIDRANAGVVERHMEQISQCALQIDPELEAFFAAVP